MNIQLNQVRGLRLVLKHWLADPDDPDSKMRYVAIDDLHCKETKVAEFATGDVPDEVEAIISRRMVEMWNLCRHIDNLGHDLKRRIDLWIELREAIFSDDPTALPDALANAFKAMIRDEYDRYMTLGADYVTPSGVSFVERLKNDREKALRAIDQMIGRPLEPELNLGDTYVN